MQAAEHFINFSVRYVAEAGLRVRNRENMETILSVGTQLLIPDKATHPDEWKGVPTDHVPVRVLSEAEPYQSAIEDFWANTIEDAVPSDN